MTTDQPATTGTWLDAEAHADGCPAAIVFSKDSVGHWSAECGSCGRWDVSGCETRAEAGAAFFGR